MEKQQSKSITLQCESEFEEVAFNEAQQILVMSSLKAPLFEKKEEDKRAPIDVCCVIDRSGSMQGEKIKLTKEALHFVIQNLEAGDNLSVVIYDEVIETLFDFTPMTDENKANRNKDVDKIKERGSTDLCGGLLRGLDLVGSRKQPNDVCSILLLTDGLANHGICTVKEIEQEMKKKMATLGSNKTTVFTFGFGSSHNEELLRNIAENGSGMYYYVRNEEDIPVSFADCLGGLQSVVAQNLSLSVTALNGAKVVKSLSRYKTTSDLPAEKAVVQLADIYSEEGRDLIFLVELPVLDQPHSEKKEYFSFDLTYFNVLQVNDETVSSKVSVSRPGSISGKAVPNLSLDKQRNRLKAADAMEQSRAKAEQGNFKMAQEILKKAQTEVSESPSGRENFCVKLVEDLGKCLDDVQSKEKYQAHGKKMMMKKAESHFYQRSTKVEEEEEGFYETSSKLQFKQKSKK